MLAGVLSRVALAALLAIVLTAGTVSAQRSYEPAPYPHLVSINPVLLIMGHLSVDYEQRVGLGSTSVGASLSNFGIGNEWYRTIAGKARYYVDGQALDGISIGLVVSSVRLSRGDLVTNALGVGFSVERQWLLGEDRRSVLTYGAGATRLFTGSDREVSRRAIPSLRLSIGGGF